MTSPCVNSCENRFFASISPQVLKQNSPACVQSASFKTRKTRIVLLSDTHNLSPLNGSFVLPRGDVLIHAGDLTNQGTESELQRARTWLEWCVRPVSGNDAKKKRSRKHSEHSGGGFEVVIVVAGNHDITLDKNFYSDFASEFHNQNPQNPDKCAGLLGLAESSVFESGKIIYLNHSSATVRLVSPSGPRTAFKIFGSPYSPASSTQNNGTKHRGGIWAFQYSGANDANVLWNCIPLDTDILVTHTPPKFHCDEQCPTRTEVGTVDESLVNRNMQLVSEDDDVNFKTATKDQTVSLGSAIEHAGCETLRRRLWHVRPALHICGHVHKARGVEIVRWNIDGDPSTFSHWTTANAPENEKTKNTGPKIHDEERAKYGEEKTAKLKNPRDGLGKIFTVDLTGQTSKALKNDLASNGTAEDVQSGKGFLTEQERMTIYNNWKKDVNKRRQGSLVNTDDNSAKDVLVKNEDAEFLACSSSLPILSTADEAKPPDLTESSSDSFSFCSNKKSSTICSAPTTLARQEGRRETCIVNAAMMASNWPHAGGKKINGCIVVDVKLPVWDETLGEGEGMPSKS